MAVKQSKRKAKAEPHFVLAEMGDQLEVSFDGSNLNLYPAPGDSPEFASLNVRSLDSVTAFMRRGLFLPVQFDEDNGCSARFRLGDADEQENAEWIGRVVWKLDLRGGRLGCNEIVVAVPPGEYCVEVRLYLPNTSASRILSDIGGKKRETLADYWMRTRPGLVLPYWLAEDFSPDEGVVPPELFPAEDETDPFKDFRVKVNGRLMKLPQRSPVDFVDVVIRLAPLQEERELPPIAEQGFCWWPGFNKPKARPTTSLWYYCLWEGRKPDQCPAGLPSDGFVV